MDIIDCKKIEVSELVVNKKYEITEKWDIYNQLLIYPYSFTGYFVGKYYSMNSTRLIFMTNTKGKRETSSLNDFYLVVS